MIFICDTYMITKKKLKLLTQIIVEIEKSFFKKKKLLKINFPIQA